MTAMASGCSICEPAPSAKASGNMPQTAASGGHHDGPQPALRRVQHGIVRGCALGAELLVGVEQQDAVLGHDADDHDEPHERGNVEGGAGDQQRQDDAGDGEHRRGENGDGRGEVAELGEQHAEDQRQRQQQHAQQIAKGFLLLLVGAAVLDAHRGGQMQAGDGLLDLGHAACPGRSLPGGR